jgi:hypothetical protein
LTVESLKGTMLERITLASARPVLHRTPGSVFSERTVSIENAKAGVVEADHSN